MAEGFGDFFPAIAGAIGGIFNQQANSQGIFLSAQQQKKLMEHQAKLNYKYYQKDLLNRWALARQGLSAGDYNPLLAVQQGINGNSSWTNQASVSDANAGSSFASGVSNATGMQQLLQQGELNDSTISLNNSSAYKAEQEAMTEAYKQLESINHSDLMYSERVLNDKRASNFEREQAREDRKVALQGESIANDFKLGMYRNITDRINSVTNRQNAVTNATDLKSRLPINKEEKKIREWNAKHPVWSRLLPGSASSAISGGAMLLK